MAMVYILDNGVRVSASALDAGPSEYINCHFLLAFRSCYPARDVMKEQERGKGREMQFC